jgi:hypothetical protein
MQLMEAATVGAAGRPFGAPPMRPTPAAPAATARHGTEAATEGTPSGTRLSDGTRVRIEVASRWPTEVWLDLRPGAARGPVVVHALRAADPEVPRLEDVTFANGSADEPPILRVRIPPSQPPGVYNGLVIDPRTSRPVGTVSVRVSRE